MFTAEDQKFTYEVKKASIDQQRLLCRVCWSESNQIRAALVNHEAMWAESKKSLQHDSKFLHGWLEQLVKLEEFVPYKPDSAKKNMLQKMLLSLASNQR